MSVTRICTDSSWPSQPLPKAAGVAIEKGNPGTCWSMCRGRHGAVCAPVQRLPYRDFWFSDPGPPLEPGSTVIWRQTPETGPRQRRARRKQVSAWLRPPFPFAPCRRIGQRVAAHLSYSPKSLVLQAFSGVIPLIFKAFSGR